MGTELEVGNSSQKIKRIGGNGCAFVFPDLTYLHWSMGCLQRFLLAAEMQRAGTAVNIAPNDQYIGNEKEQYMKNVALFPDTKSERNTEII
ncbi:MAG: hypothetical protein VX278_05785 [Myxococcota bacterium]|nr:hypothetical protein [Myxococcota bacterium]